MNAFTNYWNLALASVDRQLVAANYACEDRGLGEHMTLVTPSHIREILKSVKPMVLARNTQADNKSGHKILSSEQHFRASLKWLQEEIRELLSFLPSDGFAREIAEIHKVLEMDAEDVAHHFGTLTEGWDRLVFTKHKLLLPDDALLARATWLVSLIADFERSLRDAICLPIQCLGRLEPIMHISRRMISDHKIELRADEFLSHAKTDDAVAQAIAKWVARGVTETLRATDAFATYLEVETAETNAFKEGFFVKLSDLGTSSEAIILRLGELRRIVLHDMGSIGAPPINFPSVRSKLAPLDVWNLTELQIVAQFLYSYSIRYTLRVMDVISRTIGDGLTKESTASVARYKAASELRVGTLVLLREKLWWLAWSIADQVRETYDDGDGLMLRLNAAFAQSQIRMPPDWYVRATKIKPPAKAAPRYRLLKKSILGEWSGIESLITAAVTSGDMTFEELNTWPALASLRTRPEFTVSISRLGVSS